MLSVEVGERVVIKEMAALPNLPILLQPGATGVVRHVSRMSAPAGPGMDMLVSIPLAWVDFWGNGVCLAVMAEKLDKVEDDIHHGAD